MSMDFVPMLVKDSRINEITPQVGYTVYSGANQNTYQQFPATATSTSQLSFNISVPSENTILDRNVLLQATYQITISGITGVAKDTVAFQYGLTEAFQSFPMNASITSMNATINNTSVSANVQDILPQLLRLMSPRDLQAYSGMCPTLPDNVGSTYFNYTANNAKECGNSNPLGGISTASTDNFLLPRGTHPLRSIAVTHNINGGGTDTKLTSTNAADTWTVVLEAVFTEPLFLSPFLYGSRSESNSQGFLGLNTLNLNLNIDSSFKRGFSSATTWTAGYNVAITQITDAKLLLNFLTTQSTDMIIARNVIPFVDYPRYIVGTANSTKIAAGGSAVITSQNVQLNQIPDYFIICARKALASQTVKDPNFFYPITNISVNFNNASGLLASATTHDLWRMSSANGSQQSWYEFSGKVGDYTIGADNVATNAAVLSAYTRLTTGSLLLINPSRDLSLPVQLSNGSLGQYNFQINVKVENYTANDITPEIVIICANSGVFTTVSGSSAISTGLLNQALVVDIKNNQQQGVASLIKTDRMVGGAQSAGFLGPLVSTAFRFLPMIADTIAEATKGSGKSKASQPRKLDELLA